MVVGQFKRLERLANVCGLGGGNGGVREDDEGREEQGGGSWAGGSSVQESMSRAGHWKF